MGHQVMVVDDDPDCLEWMAEALSTSALRVTPVSNFETAQQLMRQDAYDLYIFDYHLNNGPSGLELGKQATKLGRPFILLTGSEDEALGDSAIASGACDFVHKADVTPRLMHRVIRNAKIRHRRVHQLQLQTSALTQLALRDILTGLLNRAGVNNIAESLLHKAVKRESGIALLYVDLDEFKPINDRYGHAAGDQVLRVIAQRMNGAVAGSDAVARIAGDEFLLLLQSPAPFTRASGTRIGNRVLQRLGEPIEVTNRSKKKVRVGVSASIGVSLFPSDGDDFQSLEQNAESAMNRAKQAGKNQIVCASDDVKPIATDCEIVDFPVRRRPLTHN